jgi:integrase
MKVPRGFGSVYQPTYRDKKTGEIKKQAVWWIQYCRHGQVIREPSGARDEKVAWKLLKRRHGEMAAGKPVGPDVNRTTFDDMAAMVINDYKANGYSSIEREEDAINHLREFFGEYRAIEITSDRVTAYIAFRQEEKAANSTIGNELSALSRMFTLAMRAGKAASKPYIGKLETNNARKGFFEREQLNAVLRYMPDYLKPVMETAYITGWRVHDELLTRERKHVDLKGGWLRLEPGETKNREGRNFPLTPRLREVLKGQIEHTEALQRNRGEDYPVAVSP